ncbi:hypothetical protein BVX94_02470 [bacterium B17]|nr:hypothetical protein BVX94_02470 [bacterium B17]
MKKRCIITGIAGIVCACACIAFGGTLLEVDFNSLATGEIDNGGPTTAQLNSATTGGSWSLSADTNYNHSIVDDGGDKALESDYNNIAASLNTAFEITLDTAIDIDAMQSDLTITLEAHPEATTSFHRYWRLQFMDSDGSTILFELYGYDNGILRFHTSGNTQLTTVGEWQGNANFTWDEDHARVAVIEFVLDSTGNVTSSVDVDGGTYGTTRTLANVATAELGSIRVQTDPGSPYGQGSFINDVLIESGPLPGSVFRFR